MSKTKIDWCDEVWNPVWGCYNNCPYCYARKIAKRFWYPTARREHNFDKDCLHDIGLKLKNFKPVWLESNFNRKFPWKPSRIFVNSMSDIQYWKPEWMEKVLNRIREYPQHTFLFLTKYTEFIKEHYNYVWSKNTMIGLTITNNKDLDKLHQNPTCRDYISRGKFFVSIEPIQEKLDRQKLLDALWIWDRKIDWVIVGAETGNQKGKVIPKREWINRIVVQCDDMNLPVFLKGSLQDIWGEKLIQEYPE